MTKYMLNESGNEELGFHGDLTDQLEMDILMKKLKHKVISSQSWDLKSHLIWGNINDGKIQILPNKFKEDYSKPV